ncbi:E3 ubiquitin-protein ligase TRIP12 [Halotydeus destructor]|nr:E3 ubiquitin-protein ligase TRIP12 [Halotydeus destructor]
MADKEKSSKGLRGGTSTGSGLSSRKSSKKRSTATPSSTVRTRSQTQASRGDHHTEETRERTASVSKKSTTPKRPRLDSTDESSTKKSKASASVVEPTLKTKKTEKLKFSLASSRRKQTPIETSTVESSSASTSSTESPKNKRTSLSSLLDSKPEKTSRIGSTTSKSSASATGSCASSRRRSSRLTGRVPNQVETESNTANSEPGQSAQSSGGTSGKLQGNTSTMDDSALNNDNGNSSLTNCMSGAANTRTEDSQRTANTTGAAASALSENESDDSEMGRLQALLEARGLPPHIFGALGPRMQHLLHRSIGSSAATKAQQLLQGMQNQTDEGQQLQSVMEMCQLLVMGNEDTLTGFPVKQAVPALISLLQMDHNFDIMNHACRALTYMMESLPRSSAVVVEAVPVFLEKLQVIQCMDVAEQSLTALEMLSRRHSKSILHARGVSSCLTYLDFFSINAQRSALTVTANCCQNLNSEEFHMIDTSLQTLSSHLTAHDKKCVENICLAYSRMVESYQREPEKLSEIAGNNLLSNLQQLLVVVPPLLSNSTFVMVIRMMATLCSACPHLAVELLKLNVAETLKTLLVGPNSGEDVELLSRNPNEMYEITSLIGELLPCLPGDGVFKIDSMLAKSVTAVSENVSWQWKDDRGLWHSYSSVDSKLIESSHQSGDDETNLTTMGRAYVIDFNTMQQINEDSGSTRAIQRKVNSSTEKSWDSSSSTDPRAICIESEPELAQKFTKTLFPLLYEVYSSSAGPAVRHKCLRALLRIIYYAPSDLLRAVLKNQPVSSHIAGMLASPDLKIVVSALQMAYILMQKISDVFCIYFRREGVLHQIKKLAAGESLNESFSTTLSPNATQPSIAVTPSLPATGAPPAYCETGSSNVSSTLNSMETSPTDNQEFFGDNGNMWAQTAAHVPSVCNTQSAVVSSASTPNYTASDSDSQKPDLGKRKRAAKKITSTTVEKSKAKAGSLSDRSPYKSKILNASSSSLGQPNEAQTVASPCYVSMPSFQGASTSGLGMNLSDSSAMRSLMSPHALSPNTSALSANSSSSKPSRSKIGNAASKTSSFLANLNPARWARWSNQSAVPNLGPSRTPMGFVHLSHSQASNSVVSLMTRSPNITGNRDKVKSWIKETAQEFEKQYFESEVLEQDTESNVQVALSVMNRLQAASSAFEVNDAFKALSELKSVLLEGDISAFELIHSGIVEKLIHYLTHVDNGDEHRSERIRQFLHIFLAAPANVYIESVVKEIDLNNSALIALVCKLNASISQLEQFPVRVHDVVSDGSGSIRGTSALKFFNTHQLKCSLQRHPSCTNLRQWRGGPVKIDPLALVQAIERYLVIRGYGRVRDDDDDASDDDNSDEEFDDNMAAMMLNQGQGRHKLQFIIGDQVLPYNMTVYQAVRHFNNLVGGDAQEADAESENLMGHATIWVQTHVIYYRPYQEGSSSNTPTTTSSTLSNRAPVSSSQAPSNRRGSKGPKATSPKRKDELWTEGKVPISGQPVDEFLEPKLPSSVTVNDASSEVLSLLRIVHAISRYWGSFYSLTYAYKPAVLSQEFINSKLTAKANRQLQDPLVIMTGNLPSWLQQIAYVCPFLFPFETRHLLFYVTCFDRDRALQRLLDTSPGSTQTDSTERVAPRLDRRKRIVAREDILKQAETVLHDCGNSKALLEVSYINEVGTGLGPTLEFYALVSKEFQKADLSLWRGDVVSNPNASPIKDKVASTSNEIQALQAFGENDAKYMFSSQGLFPQPIGRSAKTAAVSKFKNRFRLLGKFMAKAVMDFRMVDLPLSVPFYKWLAGKDHHMSLGDMELIDQTLAKSLVDMEQLARKKQQMELNNENNASGVSVDQLTLDGCAIEDLGLDFTLPGYPAIELRKGGKDINVSLDNIDQYVKLLSYWTLREGVAKQFEAFREGFESVFPISNLQVFYPEELEQLFCGGGQGQWDMKGLAECCHPDHGYTPDSSAIKYLFEVLSSYNNEEQRRFLQFVTGSPRLPVGGLKSLSPPLTVVRKTFDCDDSPDNYLPSVMTCVNYLKLPEYSSIEIMRERLRVAATEGSQCFYLS